MSRSKPRSDARRDLGGVDNIALGLSILVAIVSATALPLAGRGSRADATEALDELAAPDAAEASASAADDDASQARRRYVVRPGDTLAEIAARELGDGNRWVELRTANPGIDPGRLAVGSTLTIPNASARRSADGSRRQPDLPVSLPAYEPPAYVAPRLAHSDPRGRPLQALTQRSATPAASFGPGAPSAPVARPTHVVAPGETLASIAKARLGDSERWVEIAELNRLVNPHVLRSGMRLVLPAR